MAIITIFSASHSHGEEVATNVADQLGYRLLTDRALITAASEEFHVSSEKLERAMWGAPGFFNKLTREKQTCVAWLRLAALRIIEPDNLVYHGFGGLLLPVALTHVLRVCLTATREYRLKQAENAKLPAKEAERKITKTDEACAEWTKFLFELGPWDKSLHDVFLAMQSMAVDEAVNTLCEYARQPVLATTDEATQALADARLAAQVNHKLVEEGARRVPGLRAATARPGPRCQEASVYTPLDVDVPSKILLVDDEKEFVHALSERLQRRSMKPAIAYDGEEALSMIAADQPEVMVLDLKLPGIHGLEVLRQVKQRHPDTEVIILTGHGSDAEEALAAELGAFAYLRKPVEINLLTEAMNEAYAKVSAARGGQEPPRPADD